MIAKQISGTGTCESCGLAADCCDCNKTKRPPCPNCGHEIGDDFQTCPGCLWTFPTMRTRELLRRLREADRAVFSDLRESLEPRDVALLNRKPNGHAHNCACRECED